MRNTLGNKVQKYTHPGDTWCRPLLIDSLPPFLCFFFFWFYILHFCLLLVRVSPIPYCSHIFVRKGVLLISTHVVIRYGCVVFPTFVFTSQCPPTPALINDDEFLFAFKANTTNTIKIVFAFAWYLVFATFVFVWHCPETPTVIRGCSVSILPFLLLLLICLALTRSIFCVHHFSYIFYLYLCDLAISTTRSCSH